MKLSVIIPTFNRPDQIRQTARILAGHLNAEWPDSDILIVNGGDEIPSEQFADLETAIRVVQCQNNGRSGNINTGVAASTGEWLLILDDDIDVQATAIARLRSVVDSGADAVLGRIVHELVVMDEGLRRFIISGEARMDTIRRKSANNLPFEYGRTAMLAISRNFFTKVGGFDTGFLQYGWEDIEFSFRLSQHTAIHYAEDATGIHHWSIPSLNTYLQRCEDAGRSALHFHQRHGSDPRVAAITGVGKMFGLTGHMRYFRRRIACSLLCGVGGFTGGRLDHRIVAQKVVLARMRGILAAMSTTGNRSP